MVSGPPPGGDFTASAAANIGYHALMPDARASPASTASLARLYAWCVRGAEHVHAHRVAVCLIGAPLLTLALVAINQLVLLDFPNSGDEYVYLYQARRSRRDGCGTPP